MSPRPARTHRDARRRAVAVVILSPLSRCVKSVYRGDRNTPVETLSPEVLSGCACGREIRLSPSRRLSHQAWESVPATRLASDRAGGDIGPAASSPTGSGRDLPQRRGTASSIMRRRWVCGWTSAALSWRWRRSVWGTLPAGWLVTDGALAGPLRWGRCYVGKAATHSRRQRPATEPSRRRNLCGPRAMRRVLKIGQSEGKTTYPATARFTPGSIAG
ncbi:MAG: hypothetical protein QOJ59_1676 [Thermomicrobiales bacterium]|nr:hypothetical protein [Thermomicrobiales bacterium]